MNDNASIYASIREEILDQKKCQFQLFSLAVTATALILAYAGTKPFAAVYLAPIILNDFSLVIILDKAISVQRKVGYAQMMEQHWNEYTWMWETQLDLFRGEVPLGGQAEPARKQGYVTTVCTMLVGLNLLSGWLGYQISVTTRQPSPVFLTGDKSVVIIGAILILGGACWFFYYRNQLLRGRHSGLAIRKTWQTVLRDYKK